MNCHDNGKNNMDSNGKVHKRHSSHMLWMVLCCAIPLVLLFVLPFLKIQNAGVNSVLRTAVALICPLMMVFMMIPMFKNDRSEENEHHHIVQRQLENKN